MEPTYVQGKAFPERQSRSKDKSTRYDIVRTIAFNITERILTAKFDGRVAGVTVLRNPCCHLEFRESLTNPCHSNEILAPA
jgi:hypothetical protein